MSITRLALQTVLALAPAAQACAPHDLPAPAPAPGPSPSTPAAHATIAATSTTMTLRPSAASEGLKLRTGQQDMLYSPQQAVTDKPQAPATDGRTSWGMLVAALALMLSIAVRRGRH